MTRSTRSLAGRGRANREPGLPRGQVRHKPAMIVLLDDAADLLAGTKGTVVELAR
jgi:hypothetical protein